MGLNEGEASESAVSISPQTSGDFAGEWRMETPSQETEVTFKVAIDRGFWVPGHIVRTLTGGLHESVERLKTEVEKP